MIALLQNLRQEAAGGLKRWRRGGGRSNYAALRAAGVLSVEMWAAGVLSVIKLRAAKNDDLSGGLSIKMIISVARCNIGQKMLKFSSYEF